MSVRPAQNLVRSLITLLSAAVVLTGCGISEWEGEPVIARPAVHKQNIDAYPGMRPRDIFDLTDETTTRATSVRVHSTYQDEDGRAEFDLRLARAGRGRGTLDVGAGGKMKMVLLNNRFYFQPDAVMLDETFYDDPELAEALAGRWIVADKGDGMDEMFGLLDMELIIQDILDLSVAPEGLQTVKGQSFEGRASVGLRVKGEPGTAFVAADGSGELLAFLHPSGNSYFTHWNEKVVVRAPADPLESAELGLGGEGFSV